MFRYQLRGWRVLHVAINRCPRLRHPFLVERITLVRFRHRIVKRSQDVGRLKIDDPHLGIGKLQLDRHCVRCHRCFGRVVGGHKWNRQPRSQGCHVDDQSVAMRTHRRQRQSHQLKMAEYQSLELAFDLGLGTGHLPPAIYGTASGRARLGSRATRYPAMGPADA